jgi:NAD(P)-dependent dehydrogenase (short-subunit alcohol dehydrogenase family)
MSADFIEKYGPWAVIAGGSDGIGLAFAHALAARGDNSSQRALRAEALSDARDRRRVIFARLPDVNASAVAHWPACG